MSTLWHFVLLGIGLCPAYVLAAQGAVLVFRGSGVVNFAQGSLGLVGAYSGYELQALGLGPVPALIGGVLAGAIAGALIYLLVMRRLARASQIVAVVATLGISVLVAQGFALHFANVTEYPSPIISNTRVDIFGQPISHYELVLCGVTLLLTAGLAVGYRYTRFGLQTTAAAENARSAAALGHSPELIGLINWMLGGALGALAGILIAADLGLSINTTGLLLVPAFAAALLGRFTSFWLTLLGGVIVSVGSSLLTHYSIGTGWSDAFPFLVVIAILLVRSRSLPVRGELAARLPAIGTGRIRPPIVIAGLIAGAILISLLSDNGQLAMTTSLTTAIICLSITVVTGYAGQISLAQLGLAGVGGFAGAKLSAAWGLTFWEALVVGVAVAVAFGVVVGLPALRTRGVTLAIVTLGLGLTVQDVILNNPNLAGNGGDIVLPEPSIFGYALDSTDHPGRYATLCMIVFALCAVVVANLRRGRVGRRLIALRGNDRAAVALGINTTTAKLYAFTLAAAIAGLAGVLIAFIPSVVTFVQGSGPQFDPITSITIFSFVIVGGLGYIGGSLFAAQLVAAGVGAWILQDIFNSPTAYNYLAVFGGLAAVMTVLFTPDGVAAKQAEDFARLLGRARRLLGRRAPQDEPTALPTLGRDTRPADVDTCSLEIRDLVVRFGGVTALDGVSLTVRSGEVVGLIGPNGAGKTTLMDAVSGLNRSYEGHVLFDGAPIDAANAVRRARLGIGRSFQQPELFEDLPVADNLRVACEPPSAWHYVTDLVAPRREDLPRAAIHAVQEFELAHDLARKPNELPYGKRRLVGIARAVAASPRILLLDEPAAGLDDREADELATLITRLARDRGYGVLLIEHNVNLVMSVSDRVTALDFGRVIAEGTPEDVRSSPEVVAAYLGGASTAEPSDPSTANGASPRHDAATVRETSQ